MIKPFTLRKETSTYLPMFLKVIQISDGPIMELGCGIFSTPILHWLCWENKRKIVSYESDPDYFKFARIYRSRSHEVRKIGDWDEIDLEKHWGVVLIDHDVKDLTKSNRGMDAIRLKDKADYIVLHDTGPHVQEKYGYEKVWLHFKYRKDWKGCKPWTTVVSNFKDLSNL